jgi:hypothetical protein
MNANRLRKKSETLFYSVAQIVKKKKVQKTDIHIYLDGWAEIGCFAIPYHLFSFIFLWKSSDKRKFEILSEPPILIHD